MHSMPDCYYAGYHKCNIMKIALHAEVLKGYLFCVTQMEGYNN